MSPLSQDTSWLTTCTNRTANLRTGPGSIVSLSNNPVFSLQGNPINYCAFTPDNSLLFVASGNSASIRWISHLTMTRYNQRKLAAYKTLETNLTRLTLQFDEMQQQLNALQAADNNESSHSVEQTSSSSGHFMEVPGTVLLITLTIVLLSLN